MKNKFKILAGVLLAASAASFAACSQEKSIYDGENEPIRFTSGISTRATAQEWEQGDRVGIFMIAEGGTLSYQSIIEDVTNRQHIASAGAAATLIPATSSDKIFFPRNGEKVDFIAYHPYLQDRDITGYAITTDASDQSEELIVDMLYSDNAVSKSKNDTQVDMVFRHVMSKLNVNITLASEFADVPIKEVRFFGFAADGTFSLATAEWTVGQVAEIKPFAADNNFSAHMVPQNAAIGRLIVIDMGVATYTYPIANDRDLPQNMILTYNLVVGREGVFEVDVTIADWDGTKIDDQTVALPQGQFVIDWQGYNDEDFTAIEIIYDFGNTYATRVGLTDEGISMTTDMIATDTHRMISIDEVSVFYMGRKFNVPPGQVSIDGGILTLDYHEIIAKKEHLEYLSQNFETKPSLLSGNYFQLRDIDLESNPFTPIGNYSSMFTGTYDGGGFRIENLFVNLPDTENVGLFGYCRNSTLRNIHIASGSITGIFGVGGVCGRNEASGSGSTATISNCSNSAEVTGYLYVSGVSGYNYAYDSGSLTITDCENSGTVNGTNIIGGVCGFNDATDSSNVTISACSNSGTVTGSANYVGGVCGKNITLESGTITIIECYSAAAVTGGGSDVGGVCGENSEENSTISYCFWAKGNSSDASPTVAVGFGSAATDTFEFSGSNWPGSPATPGYWKLHTAGGKWESLGSWGGSPQASTYPKFKK